MKNVASDGFKPEITFTNSVLEHLGGLIVGYILGKILFFISLFIFDDAEIIKNIESATTIFALIFAVWIARKWTYKKLIKKHEKEIVANQPKLQ